MPSCLAAAVTLSSSPSVGWSLGWWRGIFQRYRSEATLLAVYDNSRAVRRCWRLRIPAIARRGSARRAGGSRSMVSSSVRMLGWVAAAARTAR